MVASVMFNWRPLMIFVLGATSWGCAGAVRFGASPRASAVEHPISSVDGEEPAWETGIASYYGKKFHGRSTANGERFDMYRVSAAHKTLPFDTVVRVTHLNTGRSIEVRINDRGPFVKGRVIDLSYAAADSLGMVVEGVAPVRLDILRWPEDG